MNSVAQNIVIYSDNHIMSCALKALCKTDRKNDINVICIHESEKLVREIKGDEILCLVLDMDVHRHAYWLYRLRLRFPDIPLIILQRRILFSDRVVAEYLGMIWLKDYDSVLAAWPVFKLTDVIYHEIFCGVGAGVIQAEKYHDMSPELFNIKINKWLFRRLMNIFHDYPSAIIIIDGILKGISIDAIGKRLSVSIQTVYAHRKMIMETLNVQHYEREFFRSLIIHNSDE